MVVKENDSDSKAAEGNDKSSVESKSSKMPDTSIEEASPEMSSLRAEMKQEEEEESTASEKSESEDGSTKKGDAESKEEKKETNEETKEEDDSLKEDLKSLIAEETKEDTASKERPSKNIEAEINRKVEEALARHKKELGVDEQPPHTKEEVEKMLLERYPKTMDSDPKLVEEQCRINSDWYEEVFLPRWEKRQADKANVVKSEQQAKESIKDKPYYATLKPVIEGLIADDPVALKLTGAEKYVYVYEKAYNKYVPQLIQRRIKGAKNQAKEKHKLIPKDDISDKSDISTEKTSGFTTLSVNEKAHAETMGITEKDYDNPLLEEGGTTINIDK